MCTTVRETQKKIEFWRIKRYQSDVHSSRFHFLIGHFFLSLHNWFFFRLGTKYVRLSEMCLIIFSLNMIIIVRWLSLIIFALFFSFLNLFISFVLYLVLSPVSSPSLFLSYSFSFHLVSISLSLFFHTFLSVFFRTLSGFLLICLSLSPSLFGFLPIFVNILLLSICFRSEKCN